MRTSALLLFSLAILFVIGCGNSSSSTTDPDADSTALSGDHDPDDADLVSEIEDMDLLDQGEIDTLLDDVFDEHDLEEPDDFQMEDYMEIGFYLMEHDRIGNLKLGMKSASVEKTVGKPDETVGRETQHWEYPEQGIQLVMVDHGEGPVIDLVIAMDGCELKTGRGISVGSSEQEVRKAYKKEIDPLESDSETIIAGSTLGGVIFKMKKGKVSSISLGAPS